MNFSFIWNTSLQIQDILKDGKFLNDCCRPWTKTGFKNSCSRQFRSLNAVVSRSPQVRSIDRNLLFSKIKLLFLRRWWQLWMKSTGYRINFFPSVMFRLSVLLLNSMSNGWFTINVHVSLLLNLYGYIRVCKRTIASLFLCLNPLFSVVQLWNYTKTIIPLRLSEYCRKIPSTSSRGLFDNIHWAWGGNNCFRIISELNNRE